jgi:hypothetical protein
MLAPVKQIGYWPQDISLTMDIEKVDILIPKIMGEMPTVNFTLQVKTGYRLQQIREHAAKNIVTAFLFYRQLPGVRRILIGYCLEFGHLPAEEMNTVLGEEGDAFPCRQLSRVDAFSTKVLDRVSEAFFTRFDQWHSQCEIIFQAVNSDSSVRVTHTLFSLIADVAKVS